jgi:hypothetical protein
MIDVKIKGVNTAAPSIFRRTLAQGRKMEAQL